MRHLHRMGEALAIQVDQDAALGSIRNALVTGLEGLTRGNRRTGEPGLCRKLPFGTDGKGLFGLGDGIFLERLELRVIQRKDRRFKGLNRANARCNQADRHQYLA